MVRKLMLMLMLMLVMNADAFEGGMSNAFSGYLTAQPYDERFNCTHKQEDMTNYLCAHEIGYPVSDNHSVYCARSSYDYPIGYLTEYTMEGYNMRNYTYEFYCPGCCRDDELNGGYDCIKSIFVTDEVVGIATDSMFYAFDRGNFSNATYLNISDGDSGTEEYIWGCIGYESYIYCLTYVHDDFADDMLTVSKMDSALNVVDLYDHFFDCPSGQALLGSILQIAIDDFDDVHMFFTETCIHNESKLYYVNPYLECYEMDYLDIWGVALAVYQQDDYNDIFVLSRNYDDETDKEYMYGVWDGYIEYRLDDIEHNFAFSEDYVFQYSHTDDKLYQCRKDLGNCSWEYNSSYGSSLNYMGLGYVGSGISTNYEGYFGDTKLYYDGVYAPLEDLEENQAPIGCADTEYWNSTHLTMCYFRPYPHTGVLATYDFYGSCNYTGTTTTTTTTTTHPTTLPGATTTTSSTLLYPMPTLPNMTADSTLIFPTTTYPMYDESWDNVSGLGNATWGGDSGREMNVKMLITTIAGLIPFIIVMMFGYALTVPMRRR